MSISQKIRTQAKDSLKGNWSTALIALFVLLAFLLGIFSLAMLPAYILTVMKVNEIIITLCVIAVAVTALIFTSPVINGYMKFHFKLSETKNADVSTVFDFFREKKYFKTIWLNINMFFRSLVPLYIVIVSLNIFTCTLDKVYNNPMTLLLNIIVVVIWSVALALNIITDSIKYAIVHCLYIDNPNEKISYYFKTAKIINQRHFNNNVKLFISYLPWFLLCYFTLPVLYVAPYYTTGIATSAKWLIKLHKDGKIV